MSVEPAMPSDTVADSKPASCSEYEMLQQFAISGAAEPFRALMVRYTPLVYSTCRRVLRRDDLAQDATQVVFIVLSRKARNIRKGVILAGWLYDMARWTAQNLRREETRRTRRETSAVGLTLPDDLVLPEIDDATNAVYRRLDALLGKLPDMYRDPVVLHYLQGKSFQQVGQQLQCDEATARKRCWRALNKLRRWLQQEDVQTDSAQLNALMAAPLMTLATEQLQAALLTGVAQAQAGAPAAAPLLLKADAVIKSLQAAKATAVTVHTAAAVAAVTALAAGGYLLWPRPTPAPPPPPPALVAALAPVPAPAPQAPATLTADATKLLSQSLAYWDDPLTYSYSGIWPRPGQNLVHPASADRDLLYPPELRLLCDLLRAPEFPLALAALPWRPGFENVAAALLCRWAALEPQNAMAWLEQTLPASLVRDYLCGAVLAGWAEKDSQSAFTRFDALPSASQKKNACAAFPLFLAPHHPLKAIAFCNRYGTAANVALTAAVWAETDLPGARAHYATLFPGRAPAPAEGKVADSARGGQLHRTVGAGLVCDWLRQSPADCPAELLAAHPGARLWSLEGPNPEAAWRGLLAQQLKAKAGTRLVEANVLLVALVRRSNPDLAPMIADQCVSNNQAEPLPLVLYMWAQRDYAAAKDWYGSATHVAVRYQALMGLGCKWAQREPLTARIEVEKLPAWCGLARFAVIRGMARTEWNAARTFAKSAPETGQKSMDDWYRGMGQDVVGVETLARDRNLQSENPFAADPEVMAKLHPNYASLGGWLLQVEPEQAMDLLLPVMRKGLDPQAKQTFWWQALGRYRAAEAKQQIAVLNPSTAEACAVTVQPAASGMARADLEAAAAWAATLPAGPARNTAWRAVVNELDLVLDQPARLVTLWQQAPAEIRKEFLTPMAECVISRDPAAYLPWSSVCPELWGSPWDTLFFCEWGWRDADAAAKAADALTDATRRAKAQAAVREGAAARAAAK